MRELFDVTGGPETSPSLFSGIGGSSIGLNAYPATSDTNEIFNNSNERDINFKLEVWTPPAASDLAPTTRSIGL